MARVWLAAGVALLLLPDERDELAKARERTVELRSYFYQWELEMTVKGQAHKVAGAGEVVAPDLVTARSGILDIVKKGDRAMAKSKEGWVNAEVDKVSKPVAANLKPPHELFRGILERIEKPRRGKDADHKKVRCRVFRGTVPGEAFREFVKADSPNFEAIEKVIDWDGARTSVEVFVDAEKGWLVKVAIDSQLIVKPVGAKGEPVAPKDPIPPIPYKRVTEFLEPNAAKPSIAPAVKEALGIQDPEEADK